MKTATPYRSLDDLYTRCERLGECILWTGQRDREGYGRIRNADRKWVAVHRLAWTLAHGRIANDMVIHHRCPEQRCINISHLECLTAAQHNEIHTSARRAADECARGHNDWTTRTDGRRYCAECHRERARRSYRTALLAALAFALPAPAAHAAAPAPVYVGAVPVVVHGHTVTGQGWTWAAPKDATVQFLNGHRGQVAVAVSTPTGETCEGKPLMKAQVWVVDRGRGRKMFPPLTDICFEQFGYAMAQWFPGTVSYANDRWYGFPSYAEEGWDSAGHTLTFPSTSAYDREFPSCQQAPEQAGCYVTNSHMAQPVQIPGGLFVLTSERAVIYGLDGRPVDDLTWESGPGATQNGGRNYGSLSSFTRAGKTYVVLVGGCTVKDEAEATLTHQTPTGVDGNCSIHRHVETFTVDHLHINSHRNVYYGYSNTDGYLLNRLEVPADPVWGGNVLFNRWDGTRWIASTLDPTNGTLAERPDWYVWGAKNGRLVESPTAGYFAAEVPTLVHLSDTPTRRLYDGRASQHPSESGDSRFAVR